jgi:hypothetical protein
LPIISTSYECHEDYLFENPSDSDWIMTITNDSVRLFSLHHTISIQKASKSNAQFMFIPPDIEQRVRHNFIHTTLNFHPNSIKTKRKSSNKQHILKNFHPTCHYASPEDFSDNKIENKR